MRGYLAFTKKEIIEQLRTYKVLIVLSVFFLFGMMSPVMAKMLPDLMAGMEIEGMQITFAEATVFDAYGQFFKNFTQMGMLVVLLVFGGVLSNELVKGTLVNILAKGLPRHTVILSKYSASVLLWTVGYILAGVTNYGYTEYLFKDTAVENLIFSMFCLWLFGCFILALIVLSGTIASGNFGGLILSAITLVVLLMIGGIFPNAEYYNPITLASKNVNLIAGLQEPDKLILTVWITCILTIACIACSIAIFRKKRL